MVHTTNKVHANYWV